MKKWFLLLIFLIALNFCLLLNQKKPAKRISLLTSEGAPTENSQPTTNPKLITLLFVGDISLAREINWQIKNKNDPLFPLEKMKDFLNEANLTVANLESPLVSNCPLTRTGLKFCGNPENAQGLAWAGFDLVNLANNHIGNYGPERVSQTKKVLNENQIDYFGSGKIAFRKIDSLEISFLGFDDTLRPLTPEEMEKAIRTTAGGNHFLVANFHWGQEYQPQPNQRQRFLAQKAIEAGADLVIGHHPHVTQPLEYYQGKPIFFSLGNFLFDQFWSQETRKGIVAKITLENNQIKETKMIPIYINDQYQVEISL